VNKTATQPTSKMPNEAIWFLAAAIGLGMAFGASWFAIVAGIVMLIMVAVIHLADIAPMESGPLRWLRHNVIPLINSILVVVAIVLVGTLLVWSFLHFLMHVF
jgi:hypothetical protein